MNGKGLVAIALAILTVIIGLALIFYARGGIPAGDQVFALLLFSFVFFTALTLVVAMLWLLELQKLVLNIKQKVSFFRTLHL